MSAKAAVRTERDDDGSSEDDEGGEAVGGE